MILGARERTTRGAGNLGRRAAFASAALALLCGTFSACGRLGLAPRRAAVGGDASSDADASPSTLADSARPDAKVEHEARAPDATDATGQDAMTPTVDARARDAASPRDALAEARDANPPPDCRCPVGDYYIEVDLGSTRTRLTSPLSLGLYCDETAPQLAHPPCGSQVRLSGCAGPQNEAPCLYLAVDGGTPITGFFRDATGQTFELVSGEIAPPVTAERLATGTFSAVYASRASEASVTVQGIFHVCTTLFQPCRT